MTTDYNGGHSSLFAQLEERQGERFSSLETILQNGFESLANELRQLREQGYIPVNVHDKMMDQYKGFITIIVRSLCTVLVFLVAWLTGLKYLAPHIFGS